jgi:chromosome segregation ATPase
MGKEAQIRAAMERLFLHRAIHTDGQLDATTLAAEAGVARQDLYRTYRALLDEFRAHVQRLQNSPTVADRHTGQIQRLKEDLETLTSRAARYRAERDACRHERDVNASQVAHLDEQNRLLRQQLNELRRVTPIRADRPANHT